MEKSKRKNSLHKVYKPETSANWFALLIIAFFLLFIVLIGLAADEDPISILMFSCFFIPFFGFLFFTLYVQATQTSITFFEDGLEYRQGKSYLFVEWHDMSHLGRRSEGKTSSYGIFLHRKIQPETSNIVDKFFYGWSSNYVRLSSIVKVPTRWDGCWSGAVVDLEKFSQTEFGNDLKYYAPHLFEKGKR